MRSAIIGCGAKLLLVLAAVVIATPLSAQDTQNKPSVADVAAVPSVAPLPVIPAAPPLIPPSTPGNPSLRTIRLWSDGNLPGQTSMLSKGGTVLPTSATISFMQDHQLVNQVRSDERGFFQVVGLQPGVYAVTTIGPGRYHSLFGLEVLPPDLEQRDINRLEIILVNPDEPAEPEEPPPMMAPMAAPMYGGGGGGGGGGLAALAGLAGLAGLGGIGGGGGPPATPFAVP